MIQIMIRANVRTSATQDVGTKSTRFNVRECEYYVYPRIVE